MIDLLYELGFNEQEIKYLIDINNNLINYNKDDSLEIINILKNNNCTFSQIKNIIYFNSNLLDRNRDDILSLINALKIIKLTNLNLLFDSNPLLLNKDDYEIEEFVTNNMKNGMDISDIADLIDSNPFIMD